MADSKSDIRVRLTAEGVADVIQALRKVQSEAGAASRGAEGGIKGLRTALGSLRGVLGGLGVATSIGGLVALGRAAFQSANEVIDGAKRLQVSAHEYSRLAEAAKTVNVELGALETGARTLQRNLSKALSDPAGEASRAFRQIRIEAEEFRKLPLEAQLAVVADRVSKLSNEEDRLRAITDLMGKSAGDLLPLMVNGADGFRRLTDEAQKNGRTMSAETAAGIDRADAAIKRLSSSINNLIRSGLARLSIGILGDPDELKNLIDRRDAILKGSVRLPGPERNRQLEVINAQIEALKALRAEQAKPKPAPADAEGAKLLDIETPEQRRARLQAESARLTAEQKLQEQRIKIREDADKRAYDQGLITLEAYFQRRRTLIKQSGAAEISMMQRQVASLQAAPAETDDERNQRAAQIEQLRQSIALRRLQTEQQLGALGGEEADQQRQLADQQVEIANRLDELEGRRHEVFQRNLQEEIRQLRLFGQQAELSAAEIDQQAARLTSALTNQFDSGESQRKGEADLDAFNRDAEQIRRDQQAGLVTQLEGENRLIELERRRLPVLQAAANEMQRLAKESNKPEAIEQAERFAASVGEISASFIGATNEAARFRQGLETGLQQGFQDLFSNLDQVHSLEDAFRSLARTVVAAIGQIAAELLAKQATLAILRAFSSFGGGTTGTGAQGGVVKGMAEGGEVRGTRLAIPGPDKIPALLQEQEHVIRRSAATQPGARAFLDSFNRGGVTMDEVRSAFAALQAGPYIPRFAEGGAVSLAAAEASGARVTPATAQLAGVIGLEEGLVFRQLDSAGFADLLVKKLARDPGRFRSALGL